MDHGLTEQQRWNTGAKKDEHLELTLKFGIYDNTVYSFSILASIWFIYVG